MTIHISARLAWHDSGWNGHICRNPKGNTYCVGQHSYPGEMCAKRRDLSWELSEAGKPIKGLTQLPPCIYSANAFGADTIRAFAPPPEWFRDGTKWAEWDVPPATVAVWPYEEMYLDDVLNTPGTTPKYDAEKRRKRAADFFAEITPDRSLIFYYANYSNPLSEGDEKRYIIVGVSRVKKVGGEIRWLNQSEEMERRYGSFVWDRNVTSHYPDQGMRLPYHRYMDRPEVLEQILLTPENERNFKYATRRITDDDALILIEQLSEAVRTLQEIGDTSEDWGQRRAWLASVTAELWRSRGLYPGLAAVLDYLQLGEVIPHLKKQVMAQKSEQALKDEIFAWLDGDIQAIDGLTLSAKRSGEMRRQWRLLEDTQRAVLRDILPRFDLVVGQIEAIVTIPAEVSIRAIHAEIAENPYLLAEQYVGMGPDDRITFSKIDHGMLPSPELGDAAEATTDDWRRLRALCVEQLKGASQHTFLPASQVIEGVNNRLSILPDWKQHIFTERYLHVDEKLMSGALTFREEAGQLYLYRREIYEDEREVAATLRKLAALSNIQPRSPVTTGHWRNWLYDEKSVLAQRYPTEYEATVKEQVAVCQRIFARPISVLSGAAGTGKTTLVKSIIDGIERGHGNGTSFLLLAPTGKAADRLRERTKKEAMTIHSFLARLGWLNENGTYKRTGQREQSVTTFIIDESSMLDLELLATFCRAVNWNSVQRLIFVGDPSQLPPIGTGRVFADLIDWLRDEGLNESIAELTTNMRQIENRLSDAGTGILDLASIFVRRRLSEEKSADLDAQEEQMLEKLQEGGDVDRDLRVLYWQSPEDLEQQLVARIVADMEQDTGEKFDPLAAYKLWEALMMPKGKSCNPEASQVISPYRGELFGVDHLNVVLQHHKNHHVFQKKGSLGGITYFDKVIQVVNRPKSNPIWAYNTQARKGEKTNVFNGEIGFSKPHAFDRDKWTWSQFRLGQFQVTFSQRQHLWVNYASEEEVTGNLELAYAISVHKSQGSEFGRVYFVLPKHKRALLSRELFYTGITRAKTHCTLLVEEDMAPILSLRRPESSQLDRINSSLFAFRPAPPELQTMWQWYEEGKIHRTLTGHMVRSKSEVIIANLLHAHDIPFEYEVPLRAPDGTLYLPDFTVKVRGESWYWEHWGMLYDQKYRVHRDKKLAWYKEHGFDDRLIETEERTGFDSQHVLELMRDRLGVVHPVR